MSLENKRILLGVTGGIAAYKTPDIVRRMRDLGADVRVVMTQAAQSFIGALSLQAVSGYRVHTDLLDEDAEAAMGHIELARWADAIVVAPATADTLARLAGGASDDLLSTLIRASRAPVLIAPAMNQAMWADAMTQKNVGELTQKHYHFFGPASGSQACGDTGPGRMEEPQAIAEVAARLFENGLLDRRHVVITAGPTQEAIDPVRYISNHSSGKMGFAIAEAAAEAGAKVTLIAGPVSLETPDRVERINVISADEMYAAVCETVTPNAIFIATAAVADFKPTEVSEQKIKKKNDEHSMTIELTKNVDILSSVARADDRPAFVVGFAAESENLESNAAKKLAAKHLDMVVGNDISRKDIGFGVDTNELLVLAVDGSATPVVERWDKCSKSQLARRLILTIARKLAGCDAALKTAAS